MVKQTNCNRVRAHGGGDGSYHQTERVFRKLFKIEQLVGCLEVSQCRPGICGSYPFPFFVHLFA